ncbi:MAG: hypothetical protein ACRC8U_09600, partial [Brooklawnia sp.]
MSEPDDSMNAVDTAPATGDRMTIGNALPDTPAIPELPTGLITLQPPPDQVEAQGAGNILAMAIPMM